MSFVTFSGIDCCGKSTQIELLVRDLEDSGRKSFRMWLRIGYTPGFSAVKSGLRRMLGRKATPPGHTAERTAFMNKGWKRRAWLYVAIADLFLQTGLRIRWNRALGRTVICDRYLTDSEFDLAMNFPDDEVTRWWSWRLMRAMAAKPDAAFLINISFEESVRRSVEKNEPFPDNEERRRRRAAMYENSVRDGAWVVIDGTLSIAEIHEIISARVLIAPRAENAVAGGVR